MQVLAQRNHVRHECVYFHVKCVLEKQTGIRDQTEIMVFIVTNALFPVLGLFEHFANQHIFFKDDLHRPAGNHTRELHGIQHRCCGGQ